MAVVMIMEADGMTTEDYDRLNDALGIHGDEDAPDGLIQHAAGVDEDGRFVVVDLWESEEKLGAFFESRLGPAMKQAEIPEAQPRIMPAHNHTRGTAEDAAVLIIIDVPDATTDQYDTMAASMPAHVNDEHPAHIHIAASDGTSLVVTDLWASEEAFGQFAQEQIAPAAQQAGVSDITPRMVKVHKTIRGKSQVSS
jgi:heme-degrading monooxygenase HmoA